MKFFKFNFILYSDIRCKISTKKKQRNNLNSQSVQQKSSEPGLDDAIRIGAIDYVGIVILHSNNLSSHKLKIDGRDTRWITATRCVLVVIRVSVFIN